VTARVLKREPRCASRPLRYLESTRMWDASLEKAKAEEEGVYPFFFC
jgi:hypothetical protein